MEVVYITGNKFKKFENAPTAVQNIMNCNEKLVKYRVTVPPNCTVLCFHMLQLLERIRRNYHLALAGTFS